MTMKIATKFAAAILAGIGLSSCGGGGGSEGGVFQQPQTVVTVTTSSSSTTPNSLVDVTVRVTNGNGTPISISGIPIRLQASPPSVGLVSTGDPLVVGAITDRAETILSSGGVVTFRFHSKNVGQALLTASVFGTSSNMSGSGSATVTVQAGPGTDPRLKLTANRVVLPINSQGVPPFYGSPYIADITITQRLLNGDLAPDGRTIGVSVTPFIDTNNGYSTPDNGATPTVDEFQQILNTGSVTTTGGNATVFAHAARTLGSYTLTVSSIDPTTQETLSATQVITMQQATTNLPTQITGTGGFVYLQGSGGSTSVPVKALLRDGNNFFVPDPISGANRWNNARFEIISTPIDGARLSAIGANGQPSSGASVNAPTVQGLSTITFISGTRTGVYVVKATADRADNNVDNGVQDGVSANFNVTVSDGKVFDVELTVPSVNAIVVNPPTVNTEGALVNPPLPDGTYSLTVSALLTDREGNPVLPGTEVRFGSIDSPQQNFRFLIGGNDGNPQEGGTGFTAPTGTFLTQGGGVGPNDTLLVFGEDSIGNRDLESARRVSSVNSQTSLTTATRFNFNDDTGNSVNNGPVLPYIIGRAVDANITASAVTNNVGVATVRLTYPTRNLGKPAMVWAQSSGDVISGTPEIITDVEPIRSVGVAPAIITVSPSTLNGNRATNVLVCITDTRLAPIQGVNFQFAFENLAGTGSGTIDGQLNQGTVIQATDSTGCVNVALTTTGIPSVPSGPAAPRVVFLAAGVSDSADFQVVGGFILQVTPSSAQGNGFRTFTLRLIDASGNGVSNLQIQGTCTATAPGLLSITTPPGVTNANGETTAVVFASGFQVVNTTPPTGSCTFTAPVSATVTVPWIGEDVCDFGVSPPPDGCPPP